MTKLTVYHAPPCAVSQNKPDSKSEICISVYDLKTWVYSGKILFHLFRYKEVTLISCNLEAPPLFLLVLLVWCLGRGSAVRQDLKARKERITLTFLTSLIKQKTFHAFFTQPTLLKKIKEELDQLEIPVTKSPPSLCLHRRPLYLRTDLYFGLAAGGSVGHIAGVLNHLGHFFKDPIFMTSDPIPTVDSHIETYVIQPERSFYNREILPLHYSRSFPKQVLRLLGQNKPAFIYQRYSLNQFGGVHLAQQLQVPFILECNGSEIWMHQNWDYTLKHEALSEKIELLNFRSADLIVVVSKPLQTALIAKGVDPKKILVNPNGVNSEKYHPNIDSFKIRSKFKLQDRLVIGFIGTFGTWHGTEILAESFCRLLHQFPEYQGKVCLLMIGHGIRMPLVQKTIAKWRLSDACMFTGMIPQEEGPEYLAACDILVSPQISNPDGSPFFGSPTKIFEYMAMGKGIIASDLDQIGEVLTHNHTALLTQPGNVEHLMRGLKILIDNPQLRKKLGEEARKEVVEKYTWKEHTRKIADRIFQWI